MHFDTPHIPARETLTVYAVPLMEETLPRVRVFWTTSQRRRQALDVQLPADGQDPLATAELVALRYLLGEAAVLNHNRTGSNLRLVVSKGAIKKLARQDSHKRVLYDYGYPLLTRYADAVIEVCKDRAWLPDITELSDIPLINGERYRGIELLQCHGLGQVGVTLHALERYQQYCNVRDLSRAWKSLQKRLKGALHSVELPDRVLKHKIGTYGIAPQVLKHPTDVLHYVFANQQAYPVLVTVFQRTDNRSGAARLTQDRWAA
jgi:hypothetical protein